MYRKILIAVENSAADKTIVEHVTELARLTGAELLLVHVADGWAARHFDQLKLRESEEMKIDRAYLESLRTELAGRGFVVALEPQTGRVVWKYDVGPKPGPLSPPVTITDGWGAHVFRYGPCTSMVWSTPSYDAASQTLFFGTDANTAPRQPTPDDPRLATRESCAVVALDARTGKVRWTYSVGGAVPGTATVIGHTVYVSSFDTKKTVGLDVRTHKVDYTLDQAGYTPIISDGRLLIAVGYYTVIGLEPSGSR